MRPLYYYVGPKHLAIRVARGPAGFRVESAEDVVRWARQAGQPMDPSNTVTATFVIDALGWLRIADRRSEHVACAGGEPVQSAGEMEFALDPRGVRVAWVTNQSTGYCPEPDSWPAVEQALARAGISGPDGFSREFVFRRCPRCGSINIVKDDVFACVVCAAPLPEEWNLADEAAAGAPVTAVSTRRPGGG